LKLLVTNPIAPRRAHAVNAAPVVIFQLLAALAGQLDGQVGFLRLRRPGDPPPDQDDAAGAAELAALGVTLLPTLELPAPPARRRTLKILAAPTLADFYPDTAAARLVEAHAAGFAADALLVPWSEWTTALCADFPGRKFAYYGNPDPKNWRAQAELFRRAGGSLPHYLAQRGLARRLEPLHLEVMRRYDVHGNVAANDADYYRARGHPNAFYLQNVWIDRFGEEWRRLRRPPDNATTVIVGSVGKVRGTANTLGLEILGRDLLPELRRSFGGRGFEVHVLGSGQPHPLIAAHLQAPEIKLRGFVPDIDAEILAAPIFLCMNNASSYKVGHTRYLHAWSLGACVVAHADAALSMPEMRHGENCLLGGSAAEIAALVAKAAGDAGLRGRLGEAGYETFRTTFLAPLVAPSIVQRLAAAA